MHPELEDFLEAAFNSIEPTDSRIGRVVVEPDYDAKPDPNDSQTLKTQLTSCLSDPALATSGEIPIGGQYDCLKKYIRSITLHPDKIEGSWVEVAPPGNWI